MKKILLVITLLTFIQINGAELSTFDTDYSSSDDDWFGMYKDLPDEEKNDFLAATQIRQTERAKAKVKRSQLRERAKAREKKLQEKIQTEKRKLSDLQNTLLATDTEKLREQIKESQNTIKELQDSIKYKDVQQLQNEIAILQKAVLAKELQLKTSYAKQFFWNIGIVGSLYGIYRWFTK